MRFPRCYVCTLQPWVPNTLAQQAMVASEKQNKKLEARINVPGDKSLNAAQLPMVPHGHGPQMSEKSKFPSLPFAVPSSPFPNHAVPPCSQSDAQMRNQRATSGIIGCLPGMIF